jgi:hypothetical protein
MENVIGWVTATLLSAFGGSFLGGYMKKKGENLATHEDINKLVAQTSALTRTAKEIETKISDQSWDRQKQWKMKRNALTEVIQALEHADDRPMEMATAYANARSNTEISEAQWEMQKWESMNAWKAAIDTFDDKRVVVNLVCDKPSVDALKVASKGTGRA